jgi:predicted nucleic acid-binding protein
LRRVVSDTGPVLHLSEARALDLLEHLGEIHIPATVDAEIRRYLVDWSIQRPAWIIIDTLARAGESAAAGWVQVGLLHAGEAAAIALTQQLSADWLLTDDTAARLFAGALSLEVHGSLGVVLWSAANGYLNQMDAEDCLDRLSQSSLWVLSGVLAAAKAALSQLANP